MTYRELLEKLKELDKRQLDCEIKVEDAYEDWCREGELQICDDKHSCLGDDYPVIFIP